MLVYIKFVVVLIIAILFSFVAGSNVFQNKLLAWYKLPTRNIWLGMKLAIAVLFFLISVAYITSNQFNPFIYFRF